MILKSLMKTPRKQISYFYNKKNNVLTSLIDKMGKLNILAEYLSKNDQLLNINLHIPYSPEHNYFVYQRGLKSEEEKTDEEKRYDSFSKIFAMHSTNTENNFSAPNQGKDLFL